MKIVRSIKIMGNIVKGLKRRGHTIGFVPTMGALHAGHLSLIRKAKKDNRKVVVSIFVNPVQFGPKEDFKKYPRDLRGDAALCRKEGADIIFAPRPKDMYPPGFKTYISVEGLSDILEGKFRPGHFKGVATVVAKLFNIVSPDSAYFGQKDAQQALIINRMSRDLNIPLKIKVMPTVREKSGLALSSRNAYLSPKEKKDAAVLYQALRSAGKSVQSGVSDPLIINKEMKNLARKKDIRLEYLSVVDTDNLMPLKTIKGKALIALAAWVGKTRLIDNITVDL